MFDSPLVLLTPKTPSSPLVSSPVKRHVSPRSKDHENNVTLYVIIAVPSCVHDFVKSSHGASSSLQWLKMYRADNADDHLQRWNQLEMLSSTSDTLDTDAPSPL